MKIIKRILEVVGIFTILEMINIHRMKQCSQHREWEAYDKQEKNKIKEINNE